MMKDLYLIMTQHPQPSSNCEANTISTPVGVWSFLPGPSTIGPGDEAATAAAAQRGEGEIGRAHV